MISGETVPLPTLKFYTSLVYHDDLVGSNGLESFWEFENFYYYYYYYTNFLFNMSLFLMESLFVR